MKNLKNALLLKQLYILRDLGFSYTSASIFKEDASLLSLPNSLEKLAKQASLCHLCDLSKTRENTVFSQGSLDAEIMFVGHFPGIAEEKNKRAFAGNVEALLKKMVENVLEIPYERTYRANIVMCHPSQTSKPTHTQAHTCLPYLLKQIELVQPKIVVALGESAYHYLSTEVLPLREARGTLHQMEGYQLFTTYHPSHLLKNPSLKKEVFEDLKKLKALL
jgi:DNA polymerase